MHPQQQCSWAGYTFNVYDRYVAWNDVPGVYVFSLRSGLAWYGIYVGQASSFRERFSSHEKWDAAVARGMTHVHASVLTNQADRDALERHLVTVLQPPLNVHYRDTLMTR